MSDIWYQHVIHPTQFSDKKYSEKLLTLLFSLNVMFDKNVSYTGWKILCQQGSMLHTACTMRAWQITEYAQHINKIKNAVLCFWQPSYLFINKNNDILTKVGQLFDTEF